MKENRLENNINNEQHLDDEQLQDVTGGLLDGWYESSHSSPANTSNQITNPADRIKFHQDAIAGLSQQAANHRARGNDTYANMLERGIVGHMSEINRLNGINK
jgi:hypothetical protein